MHSQFCWTGVLFVSVAMNTSASAATLSMRFAGGGNEITLSHGGTTTLEIVVTMGAHDGPTNPSCLTHMVLGFDVGSPVDAGFGPYVEDGSTDLSVVGYNSSIPGWRVSGVPSAAAVFNGNFLFSAGDPDDIVCQVAGRMIPSSFVVASLDLRATGTPPRDVSIVFRNLDPLPTLYNGVLPWVNRLGFAAEVGRNQFLFGQGSPGDSAPQYSYHGREAFEPLTIHQVPEPSAIAFVGLCGGIHCARRGNGRRSKHGPLRSK